MTPSQVTSGRVKKLLLELIHFRNWPNTKLSVYLSEKIGMHYTYIGSLFKQSEGTRILDWFAKEKVMAAKIMMAEGKLNCNEISGELNFSNNAHFSTTFKRITGMSPMAYKTYIKEKENGRK